jgi:YHS domain-containing protein
MDILKNCQGFLCPTCGYSFLRMGIDFNSAPKAIYQGTEYGFCCAECVNPFFADPESYLAEIKEMVICPVCLCEKRKRHAIPLRYQEDLVYLCRCPDCALEFQKSPGLYILRMKGEKLTGYEKAIEASSSCPGNANYLILIK